MLWAAALLVSLGLLPTAQADGCPAAKTCADYDLYDYRWPTQPGKRVVIEYYINPGLPLRVTPEEIEGATAAAARTWERANPRISFKYQGRTDALPGVQDGMNVVGFSVSVVPTARASATSFHSGGLLLEADLTLAADNAWTWRQCQQRDNSCGRLVGEPVNVFGIATNTPGVDLQGTLVHELGHWLSLNHAEEENTAQTMAAIGPTDLSLQTLALGDVLGVRAAYPCGTCGGKPVVFAP